MFLYLIHNTITGKYYVGKYQGSRIQDRWATHSREAANGSPYYLHRAMRKYGLENFTFHVLNNTIIDPVALAEWERFLIQLFRASDPAHGYNMTVGGRGVVGLKHGPKFRELRRKVLGNKQLLGHKHSAETKNKISASGKGKKRSAETRARMSDARKRWFKDNPCGSEFKNRMREIANRRWSSLTAKARAQA